MKGHTATFKVATISLRKINMFVFGFFVSWLVGICDRTDHVALCIHNNGQREI